MDDQDTSIDSDRLIDHAPSSAPPDPNIESDADVDENALIMEDLPTPVEELASAPQLSMVDTFLPEFQYGCLGKSDGTATPAPPDWRLPKGSTYPTKACRVDDGSGVNATGRNTVNFARDAKTANAKSKVVTRATARDTGCSMKTPSLEMATTIMNYMSSRKLKLPVEGAQKSGPPIA